MKEREIVFVDGEKSMEPMLDLAARLAAKAMAEQVHEKPDGEPAGVDEKRIV